MQLSYIEVIIISIAHLNHSEKSMPVPTTLRSDRLHENIHNSLTTHAISTKFCVNLMDSIIIIYG